MYPTETAVMLRRKYIVILGLSVLSESDNGKEARWTPTTRAGPHCFSFRYPIVTRISSGSRITRTDCNINTGRNTHTRTRDIAHRDRPRLEARTHGAATHYTTGQRVEAGSQYKWRVHARLHTRARRSAFLARAQAHSKRVRSAGPRRRNVVWREGRRPSLCAHG